LPAGATWPALALSLRGLTSGYLSAPLRIAALGSSFKVRRCFSAALVFCFVSLLRSFFSLANPLPPDNQERPKRRRSTAAFQTRPQTRAVVKHRRTPDQTSNQSGGEAPPHSRPDLQTRRSAVDVPFETRVIPPEGQPGASGPLWHPFARTGKMGRRFPWNSFDEGATDAIPSCSCGVFGRGGGDFRTSTIPSSH
jgi:hypothetical protein